jgi:FAD/FMN-containing dehydrogenase/Fe-S oxidoreductase
VKARSLGAIPWAPPPTDASPAVRKLAEDLRAATSGEIRFDAGTRAVYSTDASNYRQLPIGVVVPATVDDVVASVEVCRAHRVPVLSRGGGTSLAGQCCNAAVVIDHSKHLRRIVELDAEGRTARVQAGTVLDRIRNRGKMLHPALTFGPDPSTHDHCTIGGMIGNNACGNHAIMAEFYGPGPRMEHNVREMEVLTYDGLRLRVGPTTERELDAIIRVGGRRGEIYGSLRDLRDRYADLIRNRFPQIPRRVSGYSLDALLPENGFNVSRALVGTESTCVTVLEASLEMIPDFPHRSLLLLGFEDLYAATYPVPMYREHRPIALEGWDDDLIEDNRRLGVHTEEMKMLPAGSGWIMAEFGGYSLHEADGRAQALLDQARGEKGFVEGKLVDDPVLEEALWSIRESGLGATAFVPGERDGLPGWEDSAVPPEHVSAYLRDLCNLFEKYGYQGSLYGHFGQGCVHSSISFDLVTPGGLRAFRSFVDESSDLVLAHGGSFSGEHGDGQARGELLVKMYGSELMEAFREFKSIWDPDWMMNPGKLIDARPITSDLKLGPSYSPKPVEVHFAYPEDHGSFAHAAFRCQGIGKCRRTESGTMCPSYMVTREETHTTRGRARVLFEMMNGAEIDLWRSEEVHEALDLCLSCKGCKGDCPVGVDMATYKAEVLSHYYEGRVRPRVAYAMGLIHWWSQLASKAPHVANFVTHAPGLSSLVKRAGGIAPQREAPWFADETFKAWFRRRPERTGDRPTVILWPDTFTDHFHPDIGKAHVEILEAAGYRVKVPQPSLCCGRPLYDYGMLDLAKRLWRRVLDSLQADIRAGVPLVGMEPSCLAAFRDELPNLFPEDEDAKRLAKQSFMLSEFLVNETGWDPPKLSGRRALVQGHCHHRAIMKLDCEQRVLDSLGLDYRIPDSGCCGMAGSFGFEAGEKYRVSQAAGERVILPQVRDADEDTLIVADGFSCRTQIEQGTGRKSMHLAQVILMALRANQLSDAWAGFASSGEEEAATPNGRRVAALARAGAVVVGAALAWRMVQRGRTG